MIKECELPNNSTSDDILNFFKGESIPLSIEVIHETMTREVGVDPEATNGAKRVQSLFMSLVAAMRRLKLSETQPTVG